MATASHRTPSRTKGAGASAARDAKPPRRRARLPSSAAQHTLAANPLIGIRRKDVLARPRRLLGAPRAAAAACYRGSTRSFLAECARIAAGRSTLAAARRRPPLRRRRVGRERRVPARCCSPTSRCAHRSTAASTRRKLDATTAERARFVVSLFEDAIAPTNFLASNPAALRKLVDTKGDEPDARPRELRRGPRERHVAAATGRRAAVRRSARTSRRRRARSSSATSCSS